MRVDWRNSMPGFCLGAGAKKRKYYIFYDITVIFVLSITFRNFEIYFQYTLYRHIPRHYKIKNN